MGMGGVAGKDGLDVELPQGESDDTAGRECPPETKDPPMHEVPATEPRVAPGADSESVDLPYDKGTFSDMHQPARRRSRVEQLWDTHTWRHGGDKLTGDPVPFPSSLSEDELLAFLGRELYGSDTPFSNRPPHEQTHIRTIANGMLMTTACWPRK